MPELTENQLRGLLTMATSDLVAPPAATERAVRRQRRRRTRARVIAVTSFAAAAGVAAGLLVPVFSGRATLKGPGHSEAGSVPAGVNLAAYRTLSELSVVAGSQPASADRYVVQAEQTYTTDTYTFTAQQVAALQREGASAYLSVTQEMGPIVKEFGTKTSVIDTRTGAVITYQDIKATAGHPPPVPAKLVNGPGTLPTKAQLNALPTAETALRQALFTQYEQATSGPGASVHAYQATPADNDGVVQEAEALLWEPDLSPAVRSALYQVFADTPGVTVNTHATDTAGRPATEFSRMDARPDHQVVEIFVSPKTGAILEDANVGPGQIYSEDLFQSVTYSPTIPADPYQG
jgi:hypothetical protein